MGRYDARDPAKPSLLAESSLPDGATGVAVRGKNVFVADGSACLVVYEVTLSP